MKHSPASADSESAAELASRWIASVLGDGSAFPPVPAVAPELIARCAEEQGVAALLHRQLHQTSANSQVPKALRQALAEWHGRAVALEMLRSMETRRVLSALQQAGIELLVLKGAALGQWAYPASYLRARDDLDLLFRDRSVARQAQVVLAALGYAGEELPANGPQFELTMTRRQTDRPDWHIDVHWRISQHPVFAERFDFPELLAESLPLPEGGRGLGRVDALLHAAVHRVSNLLIGQGDRLIWLYDLPCIAEQLQAEDWAQVLCRAQDKQLAGPLVAAMQACQRLFGTVWPVDALRALEQMAAGESFDVAQAHSRGYFEWQAMRTLPRGARWRLVLRKWIPDHRYMFERYQLQHGWQLPGAYLGRWLIGLRIAARFLVRRR